MKNYNPNIRWGTHVIEVTLQQWEYKNTVVFTMGGNTKGASILDSALSGIFDNIFIENSGNLRELEGSDGEEWFGVILVNSDGEEMECEDEMMYFDDYVVGVRIIDYIEDLE